MKPRSVSSKFIVVAVLATFVLTACGVSAPGANELAYEVIATLDEPNGVKDCMRDVVDRYEGDELDKISEAADGNNAEAMAEMADFESDMESCR